MKIKRLVVSLCFMVLFVRTVDGISLTIPNNQEVIALTTWQGVATCCTATTVYQVQRNKIQLIVNSPHQITAIAARQDTLFIGTIKGLYFITIKNKQLIPLGIPAIETDPKVTCLTAFKKGVLIGTENYGAFIRQSETIDPLLAIAPINAIEAAVDGTIWIGTQVGLYKQTNNSWERYSEEGVTGFEIQDNIVEHLYTDRDSITWVMMRDGISLQSASTRETIPLEYEFIGRSNNIIFNMIALYKSNYLLATEMGLILINRPSKKVSKKIREENVNARLVLNNIIGSTDKVKCLCRDNRGNLILSTDKTLICISKKQLKKLKLLA